MTDLEKTIAILSMRAGALEGLIETSINLFGDLLPPAYGQDFRSLFSHYQESVDRLEKEIKEK